MAPVPNRCHICLVLLIALSLSHEIPAYALRTLKNKQIYKNMPHCAVSNCKNKSSEVNMKKGDISYHQFPSNELRRIRWVDIVRKQRKEESWQPNTASKICSNHFKEDDKYTSGKGLTLLKKSALPFLEASDVGDLLPHDATASGITRLPQISDVSSLLQLDATESDVTRLPQAEKIIASVYRYLQTEYDNLKSSIGDACDLRPLANILKRTAAATGVSEQVVTDILEKGKRPANSVDDAVQCKRAKLTHSFEDNDVSPIEEDSSCGDSTDVQKPNDDEAEEEEDYEQIETLKVECDDEEEQYNDLEFPSHETTSPVSTRLTSAQTVVKTDPLELEEQPISSAVHHLSSSSLVEVKHEPSDVLHRQLTPAALQETSDERLQPVKTEPDYFPET